MLQKPKVNKKRITVTVDGDTNVLRVTADFNFEREPQDLSWAIDRIVHVELVIGDKEGIDITRQILCNSRATALLTASTADCDDQVYEALNEMEEAA